MLRNGWMSEKMFLFFLWPLKSLRLLTFGTPNIMSTPTPLHPQKNTFYKVTPREMPRWMKLVLNSNN